MGIWEVKVSESVIARKQGEEMRNSGANGRSGGVAVWSQLPGIIEIIKYAGKVMLSGKKG